MSRIPALTLSGGRLSEFGGHSASKEYRVWVRVINKQGNYESVYYYKDTYDEIKRVYERAKLKGEKPDKPCAVVWDSTFNKYREVYIDKVANKELMSIA